MTVQLSGRDGRPGATEVCTANYAVSQDDVDFGSVTNTASASAVNPAGAAVCPPSANCPTQSVTVEREQLHREREPGEVDDLHRFTASGQTIDYSYLVTNTGTISLTEVSVSDATTLGTTIDVTCPLTALERARTGSERDVYELVHDHRCRRHRWVGDE